MQPGSGRAGGEIAEEAVPPAAEVAEPDQLPVDGEQSEEDGEVRAVAGVVAAFQVGGDVAAEPFLECVERGVPHPVQRVVERFEVEPVRGVGDGGGDQGGQFGPCRVGGGVLRLEAGPVAGGALGVGGEEPVVVGVAELFVDIWPHIAPEVDRPVRREQRLGPLRAEEARQRRPFAVPGVADLGVVRDTPARSDVEHGFPAGRHVLAVLVPSAAALGEQHHQVDEGEPEAPYDDRFARGHRGQVGVGGEVRWQVEESVPVREVGQPELFRLRFGFEVADGDGDGVGEQRCAAPRQPDPLAAFARTGDPQGAAPVPVHGDALREGGHGLLVHPAQIDALQPPAGEVGTLQRLDLVEESGVGAGPVREVDPAVPDAGRPGVQRGPRAGRPLLADGVVGEHRDVLGHGVHPEQRRLVVPPDPPAAGRVRVDEVDGQWAVPVQGGGVGGDALDQAGAARSGAYDHERRRPAHRAPAVPRA